MLDDETELELDELKKSIPLTSKVSCPDLINNLLISFPTNVIGNSSFEILTVSVSPIMTFPLLSQA